MIIGTGNEGVFISSDINALNRVAKEFISLEDNETVIIKNGLYNVYSFGKQVKKETEKIDENYEIADK